MVGMMVFEASYFLPAAEFPPRPPNQSDKNVNSEVCHVIIITSTCFNGMARMEGNTEK
jgi:hypothetical protein